MLENYQELQDKLDELMELEETIIEKETDILEELSEELTPALEDLGDKIIKKVIYDNQGEGYNQKYMKEKGILIKDNYTEQNEGTIPMAEDVRGSFSGFQIWLTNKGIRKFTRKGFWGNWPSYTSGWEVIDKETIDYVDLRSVIEKVDKWIESKELDYLLDDAKKRLSQLRADFGGSDKAQKIAQLEVKLSNYKDGLVDVQQSISKESHITVD